MIKRLIYTFIGLILISCAKEQEINDLVMQKKINSQEFIFHASAEYHSSLKTELQSDGSLLWSAPDSIKVFCGRNSARFISTNSSPSSVVDFSGSIVRDSIIFWSIYPYQEEAKYSSGRISFSVPSIQYANAGTFSSASFPCVAHTESDEFSFKNVCGGAKISVTRNDIRAIEFCSLSVADRISGYTTVCIGSNGLPEVLDVTSACHSVTLSMRDGSCFVPGVNYYITLLPVTLYDGFSVQYRTDSEVGTFTYSSPTVINRSKFGLLIDLDKNVEFKPIETVDLSANGTANCYIINKVGNYKFNATVKGESIEPIGTASSAEILWESFGTNITPNVGDVISSVSYSDGYVSFSTPYALNNGNAVIAVKDVSGTILWSWHIWVCEGFDADLTAQTYNNNAGTMMDRNLGAISSMPGDVRSIGLLYQWGRKDPFLSGEAISSSNCASSTITWPSTVESTVVKGSISYSVQNPTTYITQNSINGDWHHTGSTSIDDTRWPSSDNSKGLYDPCPLGWRVPDGGDDGVWANAFGSSNPFSNGPWDSSNYGMNFGSGNGKTLSMILGMDDIIWYPSSGSRDGDNGMISDVGSAGINWTTTTFDKYVYVFSYYNNGYVNSAGRNGTRLTRAIGCSVRCAKDEQNPKPEYVDLGLSVKWAKCNIGATKPEEYGIYFAWGDVTGQTWDGSQWSGGGFSTYHGYELDDNGNLKPEYDAAHVNLGGTWRMPTVAEQDELIKNCTSTWTDNYNGTGVAGRILISKKEGYNDKSIFLPAAGFGYDIVINHAGYSGYYWSSSTYNGLGNAWYLDFYSFNIHTASLECRNGFSVRPVSE